MDYVKPASYEEQADMMQEAWETEAEIETETGIEAETETEAKTGYGTEFWTGPEWETETETEWEVSGYPDDLPESFWTEAAADAQASALPEDEEINWADYVPENMLGPNGELILDVNYISSYAEECSDMIFYGDSRVVGMAMHAGGYHYVGKVSMGYSWMAGSGLPLLLGEMNAWPQADVVFCFGVNDLDNIGAYIGFYQSMIVSYPNTRFWFLSVNPVYDGISARNGYYARNAGIESFNRQLQAAFPDRYIDCYSYLKEYGYNAPDGLHYDGTTDFAVQDFAWREIQRKLDVQRQQG